MKKRMKQENTVGEVELVGEAGERTAIKEGKEEFLPFALPEIAAWYDENKKPLPWRTEPTPYHVWLSEIMLQQTRIEAVIPYYYRFLAELPTIEALSKVDDDKLMKLWQGLGYYSRARNLKKTAILVMEKYGGALPVSAKELKSLPGIGDYTAGAISSIAYHQAEPAVDGNVMRVYSRLTASEKDIALEETKKHIASALRALYPTGRNAALLSEGLMELGENICIPNGAPKCEACPVKTWCLAFRDGVQDKLPVRNVKTEKKIVKKTVFLLFDGARYAVNKREEKGLLAGLWEFPNVDERMTKEEAVAFLSKRGITAQSIASSGTAKHIFTHLEWRMNGFFVRVEGEDPAYVWKTIEEIERECAIPTAFSYFLKEIKKRGE